MANSRKIGAVVGIDNNGEAFRVLIATITETGKQSYNWSFRCTIMNKSGIIESTKNGAKWLNIEVCNGQIKGSTGSLDRFNGNKIRPYVILSQIVDDNNKVLGYRVANYDGNVKSIPLKEFLSFGIRMHKENSIPVQNAIFVPSDGDKKPYFKTYPNSSFITEVLVRQKNKHSEVKRVNTSQQGKTLNKLDEIYTAEQIFELKTGKANGVDIRVFANPALSHKQMKLLREAMQKKLNVRMLAFPEFGEMEMSYYISDLEDGLDIRNYLSPKYNCGQIAELSLATELGLDIRKMSNPKLDANEMAEIRERLEHGIWKDETVRKDGTWK